MEWLVRASWIVLAAVHVAPAAVLLAPSLTARLYSVPPDGTVGLLLLHRGAMFLGVLAVALFAAASPPARQAASLVLGVSVAGFLAIYAAAGAPPGPLRTIALADALALLPLSLVVLAAWRGGGAGVG
jgi:hypothetical protein